MSGSPGPQPSMASTAAEFVELLGQLRAQSGLAYRAIARRAQANGDVLPASTVATMLGRPTLPKRDLVVAFLRACGVPDTDREAWLTAWGRLARDRAGRRSSPRKGPAPFQLPPEPPAVVGRADETVRLLAATARGGAVCVVDGAGGVGKTALALSVAHQIAGRHTGGCLYIDLHGAGAGPARVAPEEALTRFVRALDGPPVPRAVDEASAMFRTLTAANGVLVVLDNAASAAQVRPLIPSGRRCTTLVTSRWTLADLDATARIALAPLPPPDGLRLFARLVGAERTDAEKPAATAIVDRCGGLPLALRIAGARAAAQPDGALAAFATGIDDERNRLDALEVGDLSVRASLRLGYEAINEAVPARLFRFAALPDWADMAPYACAALLQARVDPVSEALARLADAHLLDPAGDGRYRYHDIVRLFAREQAEAVDPLDERELALDRLTACLFAATVAATRVLYPHERLPESTTTSAPPPELRLTSTADAWKWFEAEHTNLLMIARQCVAAGRSLARMRDLALTVIRLIDSAGYVNEQTQFGEVAIDAADALADRSGTAQARNIVAVALLRSGRYAEAVELLDRNLVVLRGLGNRASEAACLNNLGNALRDQGDLDGAIRHLTNALAIRRELGDLHKEATVLDNLGVVYRRRGEHRQAIAHHTAALTGSRRGADRMVEALVLLNFADTLHVSGDHRAAAAHARQALSIYEDLTHQRGIGLARRTLGNAYASLGRTAEAYRHWEAAFALLDGVDPEVSAELRASIDRVSSSTGH